MINYSSEQKKLGETCHKLVVLSDQQSKTQRYSTQCCNHGDKNRFSFEKGVLGLFWSITDLNV